MAYRALYMLRRKQGIKFIPRAATVVRDGINGLSGYTQWPTFRTCYALKDGVVKGTDAEQHKEHLYSLARCNKRIQSHIVEQVGVNAGITCIGIGGCAVSQLFFTIDFPVLGCLGTFISGVAAVMPVPEFAVLAVHAARTARLSLLLPKGSLPTRDHALHQENIDVNLEFFKTRCKGFWFTAQPIMNAIAAGMSAGNAINHAGRGEFGSAMGDAAMSYVNYSFAEDGFDDWSGQARKLDELDRKRDKIIEQFEFEKPTK